MGSPVRLLLGILLFASIRSVVAAPSCVFTLSGPSASLTSTGTASPGGVLPEIPVTVNIIPAAGANCTGNYSATSSAPWLTATISGTSITYTALSNSQTVARGAALTITNPGGGSATFTVVEAADTEPLATRQVRALYQSVLGRDPDPGGFAFWTGLGAAGLGQMLDSFLTSPEAYNTDFAVMAAYQAATAAAPTYAQFTAAVARIRAGTLTPGGLFTSLLPANFIVQTFTIQQLYQNLLNRQPTASEISAGNNAGIVTTFLNLIAFPSNTTPVSTPNNEFMNTGTFAHSPDHTNALYLALLYYVILGRDLDTNGYNFWLGVANSGGPGLLFQGFAGYPVRLQILGPGTPNQGFAGSPEFQSLFTAPPNPVPTVTSLTPPSSGVAAGPITVTIAGSGFTPSSTATFNATAHAVTYISPASVSITLTNSDLAAVGNYPVVVANPAPGGGSSVPLNFTVQPNNAVPAISSLSPSSAFAFTGPLTLTINGTGFVAGATATFNGTAHTASLVGPDQLTITLTTADLASAGNFAVVVTNPPPGGGSSPPANFTVSASNPIPAITSLSPFSAHVGQASLTVTINGSGFIPASQVSFNGVAHPAALVTASQLTFSLTTSDLSQVGIFPVAVTNPAPGGGSSPESPFTVQPSNPVPSISGISPTAAQVGSGPVTLTINGTGFLPSSSVTFSGTPHTVTFMSGTQLTIVLSPADLSTVGNFGVVVNNPAPGGGSSVPAFFTVQPTITVPIITSISPPSAQVGSGPIPLTISGAGFAASTTATFNSVAHTVTFISANQVTITLTTADLATAGTFPVVLTNPGQGGGSSQPSSFLVQPNNPAPSITAISPSTASAGAAGFLLTVNGSNFVPGSMVQWNGTVGQPPLATTYLSATQLSITIPTSDVAFAGTANVIVVNPAPGGGSSAAAPFTITGSIPANVSVVAPNGSDSNLGTIAQPYRSIQKCATTVPLGGVCAVRAGTYYETVSPNSGILITSYNGEPVTVDGTDAVTGWTPYQGSIYKAAVAMSPGDTKQVFVNGQMMTEARWPNGNDLFSVNWAIEQTGTTNTLVIDSTLPAIDWTGAAIQLWSGNDPWGHLTGTVLSSSAHQLNISAPTDWCPSICPAPFGYYFLSGILAALDTQNEWYYDPAGTLYLWAPGGANPGTLSVRARQRPFAFDLSGKSNVTIQHINLFATSINMDPSSTGNLLEGISAQYVSHFTTLPPPAEWESHLTDTGIILNGSHNTLQDSAIAYSAGNGIALLGSSNTVRNTLVHHTGYMGAYASGINMFGPNNTIQNDTIHTSGRSQVYLNSTVAPNDNDTISYNNLFDGVLLTVDGGEVYTANSAAGVQIHHNWIHNTWQPLAPPTGQHPNSGVYIDEDAAGYSIFQNVVWNNQYGNIFLHGLDSTAPNNNSVANNSVPDIAFSAFIWLLDITTCGSTQIANNLVLVPVTQQDVNPPCTSTNNTATAPGATDMTAAVQVGCNFAGCASSGPPVVSGTSVAASISLEPANVAVPSGQGAVFTVIAGGSGTITYQWQRNGVNITGATNSSYITPPTTAADNGAVFTVQVSNALGSATSNPAVLTVN